MAALSEHLPLLIVPAMVLAGGVGAAIRTRTLRRRARAVERAAAEAAVEDRAFSPAFVQEAGRRLFKEVHAARGRSDAAALAELVGPGLLAEEQRRIDELAYRGWRRHVELPGRVQVQYVGLANRELARDDRVVVRINATVFDSFERADGSQVWPLDRDYLEVAEQTFGPDPHLYNDEIVQFWTLGKRPDGLNWIVLAIESATEGWEAVESALIASPSQDVGQVNDASLLEVAALDKPAGPVRASELFDVDYADRARAAALDLSLVDGRWAPFALEASVRRAVAAWAAATDGATGELRKLAGPELTHAMLHPTDPLGRAKLVLRNPRVRNVTITAVDPHTNPPQLTVEFEVRGRRYVKDVLSGAELSGSRSKSATTTERWTLALSGPDEHPWQIVAAAS